MAGFTEDTFAQALAGDLTELNAVPKAEFHTHLLLSAPLHSYPRPGGSAPQEPPAFFPRFQEFDQFLISEIFPRLKSPENIGAVMRAALACMANSGVVYAQTSMDLFSAPLSGVSWAELATVVRAEIARVADRLTVHLDLGIARGAKTRPWQELMEQALSTGLFTGVDLYGEEAAGAVGDFADLFAAARRHHLRIKLHTGEQSHGEKALEEYTAVQPHAIQHGVTAASLAPFVHEVRARAVPLHICPTSNVRLCAARSYETHPIRELFDAGVTVTINTDDISVFGQSLSQEYLHLYRVGLFDAAELEEIRLTGLKLAGL